MLSKSELREQPLSAQMLDFVLPQVEKRLAYMTELQAMLEQRATAFLRIVLSILFALLAAVIALEKATAIQLDLALTLWAGSPLLLSAVFLVAAVWDRQRGAPGTDARWWLTPDTANLDADGLLYMKGCLIHDLQERADGALASNNATLRWLRLGLISLAIAPVASAVILVAGR